MNNNLKKLPYWVLSATIRTEDENTGEVKTIKRPCNSLLFATDITNNNDWSTYDELKNLVGKKPKLGGYYKKLNEENKKIKSAEITSLGFVFTKENGYVGIDLDHVIAEDKSIATWAEELVQKLDTYTEVSQSGTGLHMIVRCDNFDLSSWKNKTKMADDTELEVYNNARYFAITENIYKDEKPIREVTTDELTAILNEYCDSRKNDAASILARIATPYHSVITDDGIIELLQRDSKAWSLFTDGVTEEEDASSKDAELIAKLRFYCGEDTEQIERLMNQSARYEDRAEKWESRRRDTTYLSYSIERVLDACEGYPIYHKQPSHINTALMNRLQNMDVLHTAKYAINDIGLSSLFADIYYHRLRYHTEKGCWYAFDGKVWGQDNMQIAESCTSQLITALAYLAKTADEGIQKSINAYKSFAKRKGLLADCQHSMTCCDDDFDKDKNLLNCKNGTLDLNTRKFREHSASDMLTQMTDCNYDAEMGTGLFGKTVQQVFTLKNDDDEIVYKSWNVKYLQRCLGGALLGLNQAEELYILYGQTTRNGKSTIADAIKNALGTYAYSLEASAFNDMTTDAKRANEPLYGMKNKRLVFASELDQYSQLNGTLLKKLTSSESEFTARKQYGSNETFSVTWTVFIDTNYLPRINDKSVFTSDRIRVIPFERFFDEYERDFTLKQKLRTEREKSCILNWLLEGLHAYKEIGNHKTELPQDVKDAINAYRVKYDNIGRWMQDRLVKDPSTGITLQEAHTDYVSYCESAERNLHAISKSAFTEDMKSRNVWRKTMTINSKTVRNVLKGYKFKTETES